MDPASAVCFIVPIVRCAYRMYKRIKADGIYGVVLPKKSGKTELTKCVENDTYMLLDLESSIRLHMNREQLDKLAQLEANFEVTSYNAFYYPLAKEYIQTLRRNFKKKKIIVFHSDPALLEYCHIYNVLYLTPNNKLFKEICEKAAGNAELLKAITDSRDAVIKLAGNKLKAFGTFDILQQMVVDHYKLKPKL